MLSPDTGRLSTTQLRVPLRLYHFFCRIPQYARWRSTPAVATIRVMAIDDVHRDFGQRLKALRKKRRQSQDQLATTTGLSVDTISNLERGALTTRLTTIAKIAKALDANIGDLIDDRSPASAMPAEISELIDLLTGRDTDEIRAVIDITRTVLSIPSRKR